jgi:hypothetical protein
MGKERVERIASAHLGNVQNPERGVPDFHSGATWDESFEFKSTSRDTPAGSQSIRAYHLLKEKGLPVLVGMPRSMRMREG